MRNRQLLSVIFGAALALGLYPGPAAHAQSQTPASNYTEFLTLNLKASTTSVCRGVAFAFADDDSKSQNMLNFLTKREACQPQSLAIQLLDGRDVPACVYIYEGKNILDPTTPLAEMASMVVTAKGKSGACVDYIRRTFEGLSSIGFDDPEVTGLWEAVRNHPTATVVGC